MIVKKEISSFASLYYPSVRVCSWAPFGYLEKSRTRSTGPRRALELPFCCAFRSLVHMQRKFPGTGAEEVAGGGSTRRSLRLLGNGPDKENTHANQNTPHSVHLFQANEQTMIHHRCSSENKNNQPFPQPKQTPTASSSYLFEYPSEFVTINPFFVGLHDHMMHASIALLLDAAKVIDDDEKELTGQPSRVPEKPRVKT